MIDVLYYFAQPLIILFFIVAGSAIFLNRENDVLKQATYLLIGFFTTILITLVVGFNFELSLILLLHAIIITLLNLISIILLRNWFLDEQCAFKFKSSKYLLSVLSALFTVLIEFIIIIYTVSVCEVSSIDLTSYNLDSLAIFNQCVLKNYNILFTISFLLLTALIALIIFVMKNGSRCRFIYSYKDSKNNNISNNILNNVTK